jgi:hypothetical protein
MVVVAVEVASTAVPGGAGIGADEEVVAALQTKEDFV